MMPGNTVRAFLALGTLAAQAQPASTQQPVQTAEPTAASAFYGQPQILRTALSPSGRWLAVTSAGGPA
jgi:hypothetical protein